MKLFSEVFIGICLISCILTKTYYSQPAAIKTAGELQLALEKLNILGSVLYIGAHPDDENTALMAYFSKGRKYRTAYLSLTRGDGGQNLIGSEKGSEIGILRTQELLQARTIDGGEQYFTRAIDFGYSKSADETLNIWGKQDVLSDMVWVIRKFKPDIIITRFPPGGNGGHGHHTASALLAKEAFTAAADPNMFPEQLKLVAPWQTKRLFWNNFRPGESEIKSLINVDVGEYNPLLGKSYSEIAAESRSMHKSQGFGVSAYRGSRLEYFQLIQGEPCQNDLFEGINTSWGRIQDGDLIGNSVSKITKSFNIEKPSDSLDSLVELYKKLIDIKNNYWIELKRNELLNIIQSCAGMWIESIANDYSASGGDEVTVKTLIVNRSPNKFRIDKIEFPTLPSSTTVNSKLEYNNPFSIESKIKIPDSYPISQPYWLVNPPSKGLFSVSDIKMIGVAENPPSVPVKIQLDYDGTKLDIDIPLLYKWNDKVNGELYRPFEIHPPVVANIPDRVSVFPDNKPKEIQIKLKSSTDNVTGEVHLHTNDNWKISPSVISFTLKNKYDEQKVLCKITPPEYSDEADLRIELNINGKIYNKSLVEISYPHIKHQVYFPDSEIKLVKLEVNKISNRIAYIMGSGDEVPECLQNLGYDVTLLNDEMLNNSDLSKYDVIIAGVRAYNTRERLKYDQPRLLQFVSGGGTLILQYNVSSGLQTDAIGPYSLKIGNGRITDENATVKLINPDHQLLNFPNKITQKDFDGWVQERGLYFAENWDSKYEPIFSLHDPDENDLNGGTLFTRYGKGIFIYSGFAWFRQLPAGVPGAYRLFINMISAGNYNGKISN
jgi:LmbE family N-acetylglucosaminyl deacetylase